MVFHDSSTDYDYYTARGLHGYLLVYNKVVKIFGLDICQKDAKNVADEEKITQTAIDKLSIIFELYAQSTAVEASDPLPKLFLDCYKKSKSDKPDIRIKMRSSDKQQPKYVDFVIRKVTRVKVKGVPTKQRLCVRVAAKSIDIPGPGFINLFWTASSKSLTGSVVDGDLQYTYEVEEL